MKQFIIFLLAVLIGLPLSAQRLKVNTKPVGGVYKKHYSHIIDGASVNDSTHIFIGGNRNDRPADSKTLSGHKIYAPSVSLIKSKDIDPDEETDKIHLTDFTVHPSASFRYGAGTGVYYPNGENDNGYPFLGIYDKETLQVDSFVYYNISYPGVDPAHAIGLRVLYSHEEEAYYICGLMADRKFGDIDMYDIEVKTKGFILKTRVGEQTSDQLLIFEPDSVDSDAWICMIGDIEFAPGESRLAFTGLNTIDDFTGYRHPMVGLVDMDLGLKWCYSYEIDYIKYAGIDVEYNTDDTTMLVLLNSSTTEFAIMELNKNGIILQDPEAYKFTGSSTRNDTTRAHKIHYNNDTVIITGNHFADKIVESDTNYKQYLFRVDLDADSLSNKLSDFTYYLEQTVPSGEQVPVYSYWAPENSIYLDDSLYMVGILNEPPTYVGFTFVNVNGISDDCVDTLSYFANERQVDDTISCTAELDDCTSTEDTIILTNMNPSSYTDCFPSESAMMAINELFDSQEIWELRRISSDGIEAVLIAEEPTIFQIDVYDMLGREVYNSEFMANEGRTSITMKFPIKPMVYLIRVSDGIYSQTKKIINPQLR